MPVKHTVRDFVEGHIYHVYNRGLASKEIFLNDSDYETFVYYLETYLLDPEKTLSKRPNTPTRTYSKSLYQEIDLLSYSLMPNNFHLLFQIKSKSGISKLMKQLTNAYTTYFNKRYKHVGPVFQGVFKSVEVPLEQVNQLVRFIHLKPVSGFLVDNPKHWRWSSHNDFLKNSLSVPQVELVLSSFSNTKDWEKFVLDQKEFNSTLGKINNFTLE